MPLRKLTSTDAFVVTDIADAPATGIVRSAPKILQGGAKDLARSASYTFAVFEMTRCGASAGINSAPEEASEAVAAFVEELAADTDWLHLQAGKGVDPGALAALTKAQGAEAGSIDATVAGVEAGITWALGGLDGRRVAVEGAGAVVDALGASLTEAGAELVTVEGADAKPWMVWGAEADAVVAGSKAGTLTHQGAAMLKAEAVVPWGPIPVTTKAFADLRGRGVTVLPDFVTAGGGLIAGYLSGDAPAVAADVASKVVAVLDEVGGHDDGPLLGACYRAEAFLATWTDAKLFGRPLAA